MKIESYAGEYSPNIMTDDDRMLELKGKIFALPKAERNVMLSYADTGNYRDVAKQLRVSTATCWRFISQIKLKLI